MAQPGGLFSFGSAPAQQQQPTAAATPFSFGSTPGAGSVLGAGGTGGFGFAGGTATAAAAPSFGSTPAPAAGTGLFSFGQQQQQQPQQQAQQAQPGFGQPAAAAPSFGTTGGGLFGQPAAASAAPTASSGFSFGTPSQPGAVGFGAAQPAASVAPTLGGTGFGFGSTTAPATSAAPGATGYGFGQQQQQPAASAAPAGGGFGFGTPAGAAPGTGSGLTFGATATSAAPGFGFGQQQQQQPAAAPTAAPSLFGAPTAAPAAQPAASAAPATGFSFGGAPAPAASAAPATGFGFGTAAAPGTAPAPATSAAPAAGFSFGAPTATSTAAPTAAAAPFSFKPTAAATSIATSAPGSLGGFSFGTAPAATSTAPTLGTGGLFGTTATTSAPATTTGFSFGAKLGTTTTAAPATAGFGGFGGLGTLGTTTTAPTAATSTPSTGLGGVPKFSTYGAESSFAFGKGASDGKTENRALQELPLPQEMLVLVEELKNQIKSNKLKFTELGRSNNDIAIAKVSEEIDEVRSQVTVIANLIQKQQSNCEAIRNLIHQGIADAEMANQIRETPLSSQAEINTPIQYFFRLVDNYRERMHIYLREIEKAESSLSYVLSAPTSLTAKELYDTLNITRNSVIALAAKVQILHEEVVRAVEAHRNLQRYLIGEASDFNVPDRSRQNLALKPLNREVDDFSKVSVLFPHKIVEPPKIGSMNATQPGTPGKHVQFAGLSALTSTPARNPGLGQGGVGGVANRSASDSMFYPPHALFQTQQSTILSSTQLGGAPTSPGASLKRSKR